MKGRDFERAERIMAAIHAHDGLQTALFDQFERLLEQDEIRDLSTNAIADAMSQHRDQIKLVADEMIRQDRSTQRRGAQRSTWQMPRWLKSFARPGGICQ